MITRTLKALALLSLAGFLSAGASLSCAQTTVPGHITVNDVDIYVGVMSAQALQNESPGAVDGAMHRGIPRGKSYYHLNVSLFDSKTQAPISGARVDAQVEELGAAIESKKLEPMVVNHIVSYGNYFRMNGGDPYWIKLRIERPRAAPIDAKFEYRTH